MQVYPCDYCSHYSLKKESQSRHVRIKHPYSRKKPGTKAKSRKTQSRPLTQVKKCSKAVKQSANSETFPVTSVQNNGKKMYQAEISNTEKMYKRKYCVC